MNAPPPFEPASDENRHKFPSPTDEPTAAIMKANLDDHCAVPAAAMRTPLADFIYNCQHVKPFKRGVKAALLITLFRDVSNKFLRCVLDKQDAFGMRRQIEIHPPCIFYLLKIMKPIAFWYALF